MPAAAVYYLTVASADNWAGAVCNLGRYFMPVAPLAVALVAIAIDAAARGGERERRGAVALVLVLAAWTALFAVALWQDPHAANDSGPAAGEEHVRRRQPVRPQPLHPPLGGRGARPLGPHRRVGRGPRRDRRVAAARGRGRGAAAARRGASPFATLAARRRVCCLAAGLVLERWPGTRTAPSFAGTAGGRRRAAPARPCSSTGGVRSREDEAIVGPGRSSCSCGRRSTRPSLTVTVGGQGGVLRAPGLPPLVLRPTGALARPAARPVP